MDKELLLTCYFDGVLSEEDRQKLLEWLKADPSHIEQYVIESCIHRSIYETLNSQDTQKVVSSFMDSKGACAADFWEALLKEEKTAPTVALEAIRDKCELGTLIPDKTHIEKSHGKFNTLAWFTTFASLAALIFMLVYVHLNPKIISEPVAVLDDMVNPKWDMSGIVAKTGEQLFTRQGIYRLTSGIVKIKYDNGAEILVEGPCAFEPITYDEIALYSGRLYAYVPSRTVGFIVSAPNAKIIDLGTGFGVYADNSGNTDIHVLDGKVSLVAGTKADTRQSQIVYENQARRVKQQSESIQEITFKGGTFVQGINSKTNFIWRGQPLDLSDIVGGGNGLGTGRQNMCIDLRSGMLIDSVPRERLQRKTPYVTVQELDYIDGIFIPDGSKGPIQVTSQGHLYECQPTMGESYYGVFNGSILPLKIGDKGYVDYPLQFKGKIYGTAERPAITLHSNLGITFDLDQIRKSLPSEGRITRFSAKCGVVQGPEQSVKIDDYSDFFVLVDGVERFRAVDINYLSDLRKVELELTENDRFLTLITTEGRDKSLHLGWAFFAEPQLSCAVTGQ